MSYGFSHYWIVAPYRRDREEVLARLCQEWNEVPWVDHPRPTRLTRWIAVVNSHSRLRGPYSGTATLLRTIVPAIYQRWPDLVDAHVTEILSLAPELKAVVKTSLETLTSLAVPNERTRFYSRLRTLRLAHGLIEFLQEYILRANIDHCTLVFENMHLADVLDQEFIEVLLRRAKSQQLSVVVCTTAEPLPAPLQSALESYAHPVHGEPMTLPERQELSVQQGIPDAWQQWLLQQTTVWKGEWEQLQSLSDLSLFTVLEGVSFAQAASQLVQQSSLARRAELAHRYIQSECTSENLLEYTAYNLLEPGERQCLHDKRAEELAAREEWSLHLGAIPYHRERGGEPLHVVIDALEQAATYCLDMGYYEAVVDFSKRGCQRVDLETAWKKYWMFTTRTTTALAALERPEEAELLYKETLAATDEPLIHLQASYAMAMLYTRHFTSEHRDHLQAKRWIQISIAIARALPPSKESIFHQVFRRNGLALIEMHMGRLHEALNLVSEGWERMNREFEPHEHRLHRSVLLYNRAQVYAGLDDVEHALADFTAVITQDPHYSEYYFDRGNLFRRLERNEDALQDYNQAIAYSPPYPEVYYNRAGVLMVLGREEEALADYSYVLELLPDHVDALLNRASLFYECEAYDAARQDVEHGLAIEPHNAQLLCTLGLLEMAAQRPDDAYHAFTAALDSDSTLFAAWTNRGVLAFEQGKIDEAIADLTHALELNEDAAALYNRAYAYQAQERWREAIADYSRALALTEDDMEDALAQRELCYAQLV